MKKIISLLMMATLFAFTACDVETDEEPGGTAVEKAAGFWTVHAYYCVAEDMGNAVDESNIENLEWDYFYDESDVIMTYNTAANSATEIWFDDSSTFFGVKVKADMDYNNMTFSCDTKENAASYGGEIKIIKGKVTLNGTTTPSGVPADAIVVYCKITNNRNTYGLNYIKYEGFRYTGFSEDY